MWVLSMAPPTVQNPQGSKSGHGHVQVFQMDDPPQQDGVDGSHHLHEEGPDGRLPHYKLVAHRPVAVRGDELPYGDDNLLLQGDGRPQVDITSLEGGAESNTQLQKRWPSTCKSFGATAGRHTVP